MVVGMDADLMALRVHPLEQILVILGHLLSDEKEGRLHPARGQAVQQGGGGGATGAVVKGEGNESARWGGGGSRSLLHRKRDIRRNGGRRGQKSCRAQTPCQDRQDK